MGVKNQYLFKGDHIEMLCVNGHRVIIDASDLPLVLMRYWYVDAMGYARTWDKPSKKFIKLHRLIMNAAPGQVIDHANRNPLDNRRANLRFCTRSQNQANRKTHATNTTGFKGVRRSGGKWRAVLQTGGAYLDLGAFSSPELAAKAYNQAALAQFGEFAKLNEEVL